MKQIITDIDKLTQRCKLADKEDRLEILEISHKLKQSLKHYHPDGLGLAAPQIGYNSRMFIMVCSGRLITVINPIIITSKGPKNYKVEGCLSRPGFTRKVARYTKIRVRYYDINNRKIERNFTNLNARIFQHELDHLNGILI